MRFHLLLTLYMFFVKEGHAAKSFGCRCGKAKKGELSGFRHNTAMLRKSDSRIVNGYEPEYRPWVVLIQLLPENSDGGDLKHSQQCGGAIINKVKETFLQLKLLLSKLFFSKNPRNGSSLQLIVFAWVN